MVCEKPLKIWNKEEKTWMEVPCRKCILCRKKRSMDWAIKLIKESQYYTKMCMITLTFSPKFLLRPIWVKLRKYKRKKGNWLNGFKEIRYIEKYKTCINPTYIHDVKKTKWLVQRFIKKLRKWAINENEENFISYFGAGEHGTNNTHRAHWHIIIFGISKEELKSVLSGQSVKGKDIYFSPIIHKLWNFKKLSIGTHTISDVNTKTIKYTANYTLKKMYKEEKNGTYDNKHSYPTDFIFSNQNRIGYKWIRRNPKGIENGFIEDNDGAKYSVPEGYKKELARYIDNPLINYDCWQHYNALANYEINVFEKYKNLDKNKLREEAKKKAKRLEYRTSKENRDVYI